MKPANDITVLPRQIFVAFLSIMIVVGLPGLGWYLWTLPIVRAAVVHYWWAPFSAAYTIGSMIWTVRAERALRALRREQRVIDYACSGMREELDNVHDFLENGNTLREIENIPLRKKV